MFCFSQIQGVLSRIYRIIFRSSSSFLSSRNDERVEAIDAGVGGSDKNFPATESRKNGRNAKTHGRKRHKRQQ